MINKHQSLSEQSDFSDSMTQIPDFSKVGFDRARAMELANLISVAYDEYEIWDTQQQKEPPDTLMGSGAYIKLPEGIECPQGAKSAPEEKAPPGSYGRLDRHWKSVPEQLKHYQRINNFWFTEWWWLDAFKSKNLAAFLSNSMTGLGHLLGAFEDLVKDDQLFGFVARSHERPNEIFVVFRGTRESAEWLNNFRPVQQPFLSELCAIPGELGYVRNGFEQIYSARRANKVQNWFDKVRLQRSQDAPARPTIKESITKSFSNASSWVNKETQIYVTGHSLGAALATLAAPHIDKLLKDSGLNVPVHLYTFASPRVGDATFASHFSAIDTYRIINSEDLIQSIPLPTTKILDEASLSGLNPVKQQRVALSREFLKLVTKGQSEQQYQHVGLPITFTHQTGSIGGNHNHTKTYRQALKVQSRGRELL